MKRKGKSGMGKGMGPPSAMVEQQRQYAEYQKQRETSGLPSFDLYVKGPNSPAGYHVGEFGPFTYKSNDGRPDVSRCFWYSAYWRCCSTMALGGPMPLPMPDLPFRFICIMPRVCTRGGRRAVVRARLGGAPRPDGASAAARDAQAVTAAKSRRGATMVNRELGCQLCCSADSARSVRYCPAG